MEIELRHEITIEDYNNLRLAVGWAAIQEEQAKEGIKNSTYLVTGVINGKTVAIARMLSDNGYVRYLCDIIVSPECQGMGVGRRLVEDIISYIRAGLKPGYMVQIHLMAAYGKDEFYEKLGFTRRPNDSMGSGMSQIIKMEE